MTKKQRRKRKRRKEAERDGEGQHPHARHACLPAAYGLLPPLPLALLLFGMCNAWLVADSSWPRRGWSAHRICVTGTAQRGGASGTCEARTEHHTARAPLALWPPLSGGGGVGGSARTRRCTRAHTHRTPPPLCSSKPYAQHAPTSGTGASEVTGPVGWRHRRIRAPARHADAHRRRHTHRHAAETEKEEIRSKKTNKQTNKKKN